uniref:50S ribosomal protein L24, chloroplastic n=2 Tax=Paramoeba aestuarina TaxID=180227 RepID=A0A7S4PGC6_9EUKA|mmetsp:Transcript_5798/g.8760  ORF Transcript_5798/g.8760 Transcript_5798/m.8760 type:complete len:151 (+) Transcript_5798:154-606(+)
MVTVGKDKGKIGKVMKVDRDQNKVTVEGLNLVKKHIKRTEERKGTILTKEMPIQISNVALLDPVDGKPCRVRWHLQDGEKVRVSKRSGAVIEKPEILKDRKAKRPEPGEKDTLEDVVQLRTFDERDLLPPHIRKLTPQDVENAPNEATQQ